MQAATTIVAAPASARAPGKYRFLNAVGAAGEAVESITVLAVNEKMARRALRRLVRYPACWYLARHDALIPPPLRAPVTGGYGRCEPCDVIYLERPASGCCEWCGSALRVGMSAAETTLITQLAEGEARFVDLLLREVASARALFPGNDNMLAALHEESGEVAKALLDHKRGLRAADEVYAEAVQCAAMALRVALEGDSAFAYRGQSA